MASLPQFIMKINVNPRFDEECSSNTKTNFKIEVKTLYKVDTQLHIGISISNLLIENPIILRTKVRR